MLRFPGVLALIYLGVVAQTSLVPEEVPGMGRVFLPALLLVAIVVSFEGMLSIVLAGLVGLILDGLSPERLGLQMALAAMLALGLQMMRPMWQSRNLLALVSICMMTCVAWRALGPMAQAVIADRVVDPHRVLSSAVKDSAWTAAVSAVLILVGRGLVGRGLRTGITVGSPAPRWGAAAR